MSIMQTMEWLETQPWSLSIAESALGFPIIEIVHVIGLTIVVGSIGMIDVRLLGLGTLRQTASAVIATVLPWTWVAFVITLVTGLLMFSARATSYYENTAFRIKLICLALAGINMLVFHFWTAGRIACWDRGRPPAAARWAGALSLSFWVGIVAAGRWIGFL